MTRYLEVSKLTKIKIYDMKHEIRIVFYLFVLSIQPLLAQGQTAISSGYEFTINSSILQEDRTCLISLPASYNEVSEQQKNYPVLILLDGYTFFKTTSGITHFMSSDRNRNYLMPETIIVAIENVNRERDFTVTKIKTKRPNSMGGGRDFLNFIEKELIPYVDDQYRTLPERILIGHSLGGLLTLNSYMEDKSLFDGYISIDPSIWWNEQMMTEKVDSISPESLKKKLYIATANQGDSGYERNKKRHDFYYNLLYGRSKEALKVKIEYFDNEDHRSVPLIAIYHGLQYIFEDQSD